MSAIIDGKSLLAGRLVRCKCGHTLPVPASLRRAKRLRAGEADRNTHAPAIARTYQEVRKHGSAGPDAATQAQLTDSRKRHDQTQKSICALHV